MTIMRDPLDERTAGEAGLAGTPGTTKSFSKELKSPPPSLRTQCQLQASAIYSTAISTLHTYTKHAIVELAASFTAD
jgi:hypothetical protein